MKIFEERAEILYENADIRVCGDEYSFQYYFIIRLKEFGVRIATLFDYSAYINLENKEEYKKEVCCAAICRYLYESKGETV